MKSLYFSPIFLFFSFLHFFGAFCTLQFDRKLNLSNQKTCTVNLNHETYTLYFKGLSNKKKLSQITLNFLPNSALSVLSLITF